LNEATIKAARTNKRKQGRAQETHRRIIDAAERLFAQHGVAGVSLRQIGVEAGSANKMAVQYYFGSRENLVKAVFRTRLESLEVRRDELLQEVITNGGDRDPSELLRAMLWPLTEQTDSAGVHSYALFLLNQQVLSLRLEVDAPVTAKLSSMLAEVAPPMPTFLFRARTIAAVNLFINALVSPGRYHGRSEERYQKAEWLDAIGMATAVMMSPPTPEALESFQAET
jgi:TetR/AcrR family transcriptional regulator, regulator of cefoperazone and chloramphenicol sensitivity